MAHRHKDSRAKWTTTDTEPEVLHPADVLTAAEVAFVKVLIAAHGQGGTTPLPPNPPPPPTPDITAPVISGVTVSGITTTTATITWTTNEAATGLVEYGTTTGYGTQTAATSSGTSHSRTLTGLTPGQAYQFQVRATDTASNVGLSGNRTFTTTAAATLPGAPTGLVATGGNTQVALTWAPPASNGGSAITGYRVYRNGASLVVLGAVLNYTNTGLTNGLTYSYTVAAITAVGEGPQSGSASATPAAAGDVNPPNVSNVVVGSITQTGATITCNTNEASTVIVEYGTGPGYGSQTTATSSGTSHSRTLSGLVVGTTYYFRVRATDTAGNLRLDTGRSFTTQSAGGSGSVTVASVSALKAALAVNANTEIIVTNGTYAVSGASSQAANSLWIGSAYASRTNPVTVRAATTGGVTFDGSGGANGMLSFNGGAHHQTWEGFNFANSQITQTGVIQFAGYPGLAPPYNITLRNFTIASTVRRTTAGGTNEHAVYFSTAVAPFTHDILIEDLTVEATHLMGLATGIHHDHGIPPNPERNAWNVTVRDLVFHGNNGTGSPAVQQPITLWQPPIHDWLFDGATITNAGSCAIRFESIGAANIVFKDITSTNSGQGGFVTSYIPGGPYSQGSPPPGVTFINCSLA